jgi:hypothetical protein
MLQYGVRQYLRCGMSSSLTSRDQVAVKDRTVSIKKSDDTMALPELSFRGVLLGDKYTNLELILQKLHLPLCFRFISFKLHFFTV